jgi:hypothetical protein
MTCPASRTVSVPCFAQVSSDDGRPESRSSLAAIVVRRDDVTEIVIHAMKMRRMYELLLREMGDTDD